MLPLDLRTAFDVRRVAQIPLEISEPANAPKVLDKILRTIG